MYINKNTIVRRIRRAAYNYKIYLIGKTFLFVYGDNFIEIIFKKSCFLHLTGVKSTLDAESFFKHAINGNHLKPSEISFDPILHPADLANKKTKLLHDLYKITCTDVFIVDHVTTMTAVYKLGLTDFEMTILFGENTDRTGNKLNDCLVPYSFRVESINNNKFENMYSVDFIFSKNTGDKKYNIILFQDKKEIRNLPDQIKKKLDITYT